ncbi:MULTISPECIES: cytochrome d ubiquinol oxidase subunit II [unclassified Mucilaginibacter]|uniref:cytochrome d ubiquinol oxidase subunit II n=1 Tax=unclassified Mucilaginibacter TaxID=2617802 RepID=UPI002AC95B07|nr:MULTISPECIES: cytochrome d ubiquinol oxidase subunit II [unclassified Mucilaginibacter]MEB0260273.1 cytochrome d ubiquinol oxidase subunit II [Mucilaginibacter sp. 10I4]MEB0277316.1 cytochrome d ubiquinol oxidase subunit II [Mucilaginibacter sp. 10B2]MEB0302167.1 cytochrome d ubiquinol oxidase subunit II [Mucilaginibacter sp. 5C4]WPX25442.1 cytochrome d ubiquinol oxidase subunit II [Mucilaginibacter sp. 5C4]
MIYVVIVFLWVALLLYLVMGGADFGAGIIEMFTSNKNKSRTRKIMYNAIGPIWEANHMWLIIAIVILFVGFPVIYATMSTYLHIPLTVMLMGIIARGTALTFRNYDAVHDNMQKVYNKIFVYSSFITPLFLGIIAGSAVSGRVDPQATNFMDAYIYSWLNWFSVAIGLFTVALCGFLAAIYLIGETKDEAEHKSFIRKAKLMNVAAVVAGSVVFIASVKEHIPLVQWVFGNIIGIAAVSAATISLIALWYLIAKGKRFIIRVLAGFQMTMILLTTTYKHYPNIIILKNGGHLSLIEDQGAEKTIQALGVALLVGSLFILPALFYLIWSFQYKPEQVDNEMQGH